MDKVCDAHSGIIAKINQICKSDDSQWKEINGMKKILLTSLGMVVLTLIGVIVNLALALMG